MMKATANNILQCFSCVEVTWTLSTYLYIEPVSLLEPLLSVD